MKTDPDADTGVKYDPALTPRSGGGRTAALAAAVGVGLALVGIGVAVGDGDDAPPRMEVRAGSNRVVVASDDTLSAHNSPTVVASPTDPDTLVVAARTDRPQLSLVVSRSDDAGATWTSTDLPLPAGEVRGHAPDLAFDNQGNLYAAFTTMSDPGNNPTGLWVSKSDDAGASFAAPTRVAEAYAYQPRVVVNGETVHVTFVQASASVEGVVNGFGPPPNPVVMATSSDGGATFGGAVTVSGARERVGAATPFFGIDGELMVLFEDFGDDTVDFAGESADPAYDGSFELVMSRLTGGSFQEVSVVDDAVKATDRFNPYTPVYPSVAVAPRGEAPRGDAMYVAWGDGGDGDWDVVVRRSDDGGATWGNRVRVSPADGAGTHQYLPAVSVAINGRVDIAFLDRSDGGSENHFAAAALATSFDAGVTWETIAVSDELFDSRVGPLGTNPSTAEFGSRLGIVSQQERALTVWTDSRAGNEGTGRQEIYFAPVRIAPEVK